MPKTKQELLDSLVLHFITVLEQTDKAIALHLNDPENLLYACRLEELRRNNSTGIAAVKEKLYGKTKKA